MKIVPIACLSVAGFLAWTGFSAADTLIFQTGFEPGSTGVGSPGDPDAWLDITGKDNSKLTLSDWTKDLEERIISTEPLIQTGKFSLQYEDTDGTSADRYARIVPDPENPKNSVMSFFMTKGLIRANPPKGRVQANLYGNIGLHDFSLKYRLRLDSSIRSLETLPTSFASNSSWLTLAEFWNGIPWDRKLKNTGRMGLTLTKETGENQPLCLHVSADNLPPGRGFVNMWSETNKSFKVPYDHWMTVEIYVKEGQGRAMIDGQPTGEMPDAAKVGRFFVAVTPDGGPRTVVFDVKDWTYDRLTPAGQPTLGWMGINPMKIYTSKFLLDRMRESGAGGMRAYWDDLEIWQGRGDFPIDAATPTAVP